MYVFRRAILVLLSLLWTSTAFAVLTDAQYDVLKTDITVTNQVEFQPLVDALDDQAIADKYNLLASPAYWVWRTSLPEKEIYEATADGGGTWNWTTFKGQTVQERDSWNTMMHPLVINPSLAQTRASYDAIFGGQGASATQRNFLLALSRRPALRIEALLIVAASGNGSTATPAVMGYEGQIRAIDIAHALRGVPLS